MTIIEQIMLSVCFGINVGWLISSIIIMIVDLITAKKLKHKIKKGTDNTLEKAGDNQ